MNTNTHLRELPDVPPEILQAALDGSLVIFVGAGISRLAGGPSWNELSYKALEQLANERKITFSELDQLSRLDARTQLTIASQIEKAVGFNIDYQTLLEPKGNSEIYDFLDKIGCVFVTTNYDNLLDPRTKSTEVKSVTPERSGRDKLICRPDQFLIGVLRAPGTVVHLHGSVEDRDSMIITTSDYIKHYGNSFVKDFLFELFDKHTVLFVGYGLEENEVLEQMLRKGQTEDRVERKRFLLQGYYSHQEDLFRYMLGYFKDCFGVHVCGYKLDFHGFRQLEIIIKDWSTRIEVRPPALADDLDFVLEAAHE